jgi:hypothetical protein
MNRLVLAVLLLAGTAFAQSEPPPSPPPPERPIDEPRSSASGNGVVLELDVLGVNSFGSVFGVLSTGGSGTGAAAAVVSPSAAIGFGFGTNAILVNIALLGFGPGTNVSFSLSPLFRHYFSEFKPGAVNLFVEGGLTFGILSPASGNANYLIGLFGGLGAEWLFVKNIGLIVDVLLEYGHAHFEGGGFGSGSTNADVIGMAGNVGLIVHW